MKYRENVNKKYSWYFICTEIERPKDTYQKTSYKQH